jgi:threonyl-tRNA synthetase
MTGYNYAAGDPVNLTDPDGREVYRHSTAHVMAQAVKRLYGGQGNVRLGVGPVIENGFYYDMDVPVSLSQEDLPQIEKEMKKIIKENVPVERKVVSRDEALDIYEQVGDDLKLELIRELPEDEPITIYEQGEFFDLCRGPHVPSTGRIPHDAFKITSLASSYWHGDADSDRLLRVYGTAFADKKQLDRHLEQLEEARKRDHRVIGKQLRLFHTDETVGQGLILWTPNGAVVRQELMNFIGEELGKQGYHQIFTPHIGKLELYKTSGHFPYYQESQYPPLIHHEHLKMLADEGRSCAQLSNAMKEGDVEGYLLKPMNCPHHIKVFDSQPHSYRDLPVLLAEIGTVYRWEQSGEVGGMTRVRGFTVDNGGVPHPDGWRTGFHLAGSRLGIIGNTVTDPGDLV